MFYEVIATEVFRNGSGMLTYSSELELKPGHLVTISLGKKTIIGIIWRKLTPAEAQKITFRTKPIKKLLLPVPLPAQLLVAMPWLAEYYLSPLPIVASSILPTGLAARGAFNCLLPTKNKPQAAEKRSKSNKTAAKRQQDGGRTTLVALDRTKTHDVLKLPLIPLNQPQKNALQSLAEAPGYTRLLRGVTGSGKTNIYLKLTADALKRQKSTILLVPEIALTSQLVKVFQQTFGDRVVLIHSNQTLAERREVWLKLLFSGQNIPEILETIRLEEERQATLQSENPETAAAQSRGQTSRVDQAKTSKIGARTKEKSEVTADLEIKTDLAVVTGLGAETGSETITGPESPQNLLDLTDCTESCKKSRSVAESVRLREVQASLFVNDGVPKMRRRSPAMSAKSPFDVLYPLTLERLCDIMERNAPEPLVVIGPRSALFVPLQNLGQIIIDEAHEGTYYQENTPRYSALRLASLMASRLKIPCLLGSATPNVVDYHLAKCKKSLVELNEKAKTTAKEPDFTIIDFKKRELFYKNRYFSTPLIKAISRNLEQQQQTLIFHNRRGSSPLTICEDCGWQALCPTCYLPMTLHADSYVLTCHICGHEEKVPSSCPNCQHAGILHKGFGTKLLETELQRLFPQAKIARFDGDNKKGGDLASKYNEVKRGAIDILIGTQTLARGLDLPHLATVGVVQADAGLALPDFAAEERAFELLTQVFGRVGRGHLETANVFIQTYQPDHPAIRAAVGADFCAFAEYLLKKRRAQFLPPFCYLARLAITYKTEKTTLAKIRAAYAALRRVPDLKVSPPMPAFHERTQRGYTWQLILKSTSRETLRRALIPFSAYHIELDPPSLL